LGPDTTAASTAAKITSPIPDNTTKKPDVFSPLDENEFTMVKVKVGKDEFSKSIGKGGFLDRIDPDKATKANI
jgi:hypothetical protein